MTEVPQDHPRRDSLEKRERLVRGWRDGVVATAGLIAHGRGETFDYLLGEETIPAAEEASRAAAAALLDGHSVISVNGNTAALCPADLVELSETFHAPLEVNLYHRTEERLRAIANHLRGHGASEVKGLTGDGEIPGLSHGRGIVDSDGIGAADTVLVPLEDGDRTEALRDMGKTVVAIDLNPLSRTARTASVTVVDEVTRAVPQITNHGRDMERGDAEAVLRDFDNETARREALRHLRRRLDDLSAHQD